MEALIAFSLIAAPGVLALELVQAGRPPRAHRDRGRDIALYLLLSAAVWAVAVGLLAADDQLTRLIRFEPDRPRQLVGIVGPLTLDLLLAALIVGVTVSCGLFAISAAALRLHDPLVDRKARWSRPLAGLLSIGISPSSAWDRLLAGRGDTAQVVHVRLQDGRDLYGVFARRGRADWEREGRGLLLDSELVERAGRLVDVPNSRGLFIQPDAVASVSFIGYSPDSRQDEEYPLDDG